MVLAITSKWFQAYMQQLYYASDTSDEDYCYHNAGEASESEVDEHALDEDSETEVDEQGLDESDTDIEIKGLPL